VLRLGMTKSTGMDGRRVYDCFHEGRHRKIADYCLRDVKLTREIYYRLTFEQPVDSTAH
jgi:predicted PolB exonuclease-like 3'-5' exonuclease